MALIKCPECGKEISDKAASCPNCGFPISETKVPQKEREVELMGRMKARTEGENIEIYLDGNLLFRAKFRDFTLLYNKEVTDELGSTQLKVAFSSPRYDRPFKICEKISSPRYRNAKDFAKEVAEKYFKKSYVVDWRLVEEYAREHREKVDVIEPVKNTFQENYSVPKEQYTPQKNVPKKKRKGGCLTYFGWIFVIFILIGWYSSKTEKKSDTPKTQTEENSSYESEVTPTVAEVKQEEAPITFENELETFNAGGYAYITNDDLYKYAANMSGANIYTVATVSDIKDNKVQVTIGDKFMMSDFNVSDSKLYAKYESGLKDDDVVAVLGTVSSVDSWGFMGDSIKLDNCMVFAKGDDANSYKKDTSDDSLSQYFVVTEEVANTKEVSEEEYKALCQNLNYNDILRNPDSYDKKYCIVSGTIDQVLEGFFGGYTLYIVDGSGNKWDCSYSYKDGETHYLEGDWVTVYGTCNGTSNSTTLLGKQVTLPSIDVEYIN